MKIGQTLTLVILILMIIRCDDDYTPKPKAYVRIELPEPSYIKPDSNTWDCPYTFEASRYSYLTLDKRHRNKPCWYNIYYPKFDATIHLTYTEVNDDLSKQIEDNRKLAMKHVSMATAINESRVENESAHVYGLIYEFRGETASDMQFFLTDSTDHFLRGSLYFNVKPNKDSLAPVIDYIKGDIKHLVQSLEWVDDV